MLIGLDIGGTKIEGVVLSRKDSSIIHRLRVATPKTGYSDFLAAVKGVIEELRTYGSVKSIGIGCCGSLDQVTQKMKGANILYLNGEHFLSDLQESFDLPIAITNDANCLAISEFESGAAKDVVHSCLAVIIGTGCGGGIIANGRIIDGLNGLGGEVGHNPLPNFLAQKDGEPAQCFCGAMNCNEVFVSGTGFERTWKAINGYDKKALDVFEDAARGDERALQHIELYTDQLARCLASIVNVIDPEIIVLGGGVSNQDMIYPLVQKKLSEYTFGGEISTPVVKAENGDSSGVLGAAFLPPMKGMV